MHAAHFTHSHKLRGTHGNSTSVVLHFFIQKKMKKKKKKKKTPGIELAKFSKK